MAVNPKDDILRLDSNVPYQISVLSHRIARETAAITERHGGLNISQWRVMAAVAERPGRTANEVVAITPMDKGIVSRAVKALLDKGMLARKASNEDGRARGGGNEHGARNARPAAWRDDRQSGAGSHRR